MERTALQAILSERKVWNKTTEEFSPGMKGGIWLTAEEGDLFDYYAWEWDCEEKSYIMGTKKEFHEELKRLGWFAEFYDPGTVMLWEA